MDHSIPDAPWIRDPERYRNEFFYLTEEPLDEEDEDDEEEDDEEDD